MLIYFPENEEEGEGEVEEKKKKKKKKKKAQPAEGEAGEEAAGENANDEDDVPRRRYIYPSSPLCPPPSLPSASEFF